MSDKPYQPRLGGRYEVDQDTGKPKRVEGTERAVQPAQKKAAPAKASKPAAKSRKES